MRLLRIALCAALLTVSAASMGQTSPADLVLDVPFDFVVEGQALPKGLYIVRAVDDSLVRIFKSQTNGLYAPTRGTLPASSDGSKLVFHRYADTYFLSAVWVGGKQAGRELFPSCAEREFANRKAEMEVAVVRPGK
jgi:hypothetical protein